MSKNFKFELNIAGLNELMKSPEMQAHLQMAGHEVAMVAGNDFSERVHDASFISIANVYPTSKKAARLVYKENVLLKALQSVGLKMSK